MYKEKKECEDKICKRGGKDNLKKTWRKKIKRQILIRREYSNGKRNK